MRLLPETSGSLLLLICHSLLGASSAEDPECRCIDPWTDVLLMNLTHWRGNQQCLSYRPLPGQQPFCYPIDYGSRGCATYDATLPPDCMEDGTSAMAQNLPAFCADPWCYVDKYNCNLEAHPSEYFPGANLSYSYATCGTLNSFREALLVKSLEGRTLRVGVPGMEPPFLSRDAAGQIGGIAPAFLALMAADAGFTFSFWHVFNDSRTLYPQSSYTACVRDVALKRFDLCTGIFWETTQRRALTQFSPLFFPDLFSLVVFRQEVDESLLAMVERVFKPFSLDLWAVVLCLTFMVGLTLSLFGEFEGVGIVKSIIMAQFLAFLKLLGQTGWGRLHTVASGFVASGFGFVCMVSLTSYMANTAAMMVSADVHPAFENIEDALMQGARICVLEPLTGPLVGRYPLAAELIVTTGWFDESIAKMDAGECDAMLLNENEYTRMHGGVDYYGTGAGGKKAHCNKIRVGPVVLTMPVAMPLHKDITFAMSYMVTKASANGAWETAALKYKLTSDVCKVATEKKVRPLTPKDLSGALITCCVLLVVGVCLHLMQPTIERYGSKAIPELHKKKEGSESSSLEEIGESISSTELMTLPGLGTRIATMYKQAAELQKDFVEMQQAAVSRAKLDPHENDYD